MKRELNHLSLPRPLCNAILLAIAQGQQDRRNRVGLKAQQNRRGDEEVGPSSSMGMASDVLFASGLPFLWALETKFSLGPSKLGRERAEGKAQEDFSILAI